MITPEEFLKCELEWGISATNEAFTDLAKATVSQLRDYDFKSVLDFGAGTGVYAEAYRKAGYDTFAYEIWDAHKNYIKSNFPELTIIDKPITTDLMNFIEVAEHMTDKELNSLFKSIKPNYIIFSSTSNKTDWDADWGHINVKEQSEWIEFFNAKGYTLIKELNYPTNYTKLWERINK
jgi:2-polyprenyl-3-methyl-5-hydroxy-6-metoxy-1,4-benzoquinol methylase